MKKEYYICIDVGGTAIKYAFAESNGCLLKRAEMPTQAKIHGGAGIMDKIKTIIKMDKTYSDEFLLKGVAISTAGIVDAKKGQIVYALPAVLPGYTGMKIKQIVENEFQISCCVENDVNCAALGEMWLGAGQGKSSLFCLTVGTSIGGCGILDRKVIRGISSSAGEIANMRISDGLLHEFATTTRLVEDVAKVKGIRKEELNGKMIFAWAKNGDADAQQAIYAMVQYLADGIANIAAVLNPEIFILGGGIMAQDTYLKPLIDAALKERLFANVYQDTEIAFAKLGNNAGLLGALYNFLQQHK